MTDNTGVTPGGLGENCDRLLHCPACMEMVVQPTTLRGQCDHCGYKGDFPHWTLAEAEVRRLRLALESAPTVVASLMICSPRGSGERHRALHDAFSEVRKHVEAHIGKAS